MTGAADDMVLATEDFMIAAAGDFITECIIFLMFFGNTSEYMELLAASNWIL